MPPPPPKTVNITGASGSGSAGRISDSDFPPKPTGVQASANIGNLAINVFDRFIFDLQVLCQQYNIGMAGYAEPASASACYCKGTMSVYGMIQLFYLDSYKTEQLWNFQYAQYAANNNWRPWIF